MWTQYLNLPMGPRPGQDNNICAMDYYEFYGADDRKRMIDRTLEGGFTHAVTGPLFDADGYHGKYPTNTDLSQRYFDHYLDAMQEWADAKIIPVHFQKPDGWALDQLKWNMEHLYAQDRAKVLLPIKVPAGWEPWKYEASSRTWGAFFDWASEVDDQKSLILAHSVADVDALVGTDAAYDDNGRPNNESWVYLAPKLHGWLIQLGGYVGLPGVPTEAQLSAWRTNLHNYFVDNFQRFHEGKHGWPTGSKFGPGVPLKRYYGEGGSFKFFWDGSVPETLVQSFGDIAVDAGADGYLDGGTVGVP
jgi:hypothetical protein